MPLRWRFACGSSNLSLLHAKPEFHLPLLLAGGLRYPVIIIKQVADEDGIVGIVARTKITSQPVNDNNKRTHKTKRHEAK